MSPKCTYYLVAGSESSFPIEVEDVAQSFVSKIQSYYPDNPVTWTPLRQIQEALSENVIKARKMFPDAAVVTLSNLYYPFAEHEIKLNRLVTKKLEKIGTGPRPGAKPLAQQVEDILTLIQKRPVIAVDDTLFHGDTLDGLRKTGLNVVCAVEFFSGVDVKARLESEGCSVLAVCVSDDYVDIMPLHDFLPPLPLCGKVIGTLDFMPLIEDGLSFSVPYLMPWASPTIVQSWATIPQGKAKDFSIFAIRHSIDLMGRMWHFGFTTLRNAAMLKNMRTSVPYIDEGMPNLDTGICVVLEGYLHKLEQEN